MTVGSSFDYSHLRRFMQTLRQNEKEIYDDQTNARHMPYFYAY